MDKLTDLERILTNNFELVNSSSAIDSESEYLKKLQKALAIKIESLINSNLEKLLQILYRIDVPQAATDEAFNLGEIKQVSMQLAEEVIRRQLKKIDYSREFYSK